MTGFWGAQAQSQSLSSYPPDPSSPVLAPPTQPLNLAPHPYPQLMPWQSSCLPMHLTASWRLFCHWATHPCLAPCCDGLT